MPSAVDVEIFSEPRPEYTPDMLKSSKLNDQYNADVEDQRDRFGSAGKRLCQWFNDHGGKFKC